MKILVIPDCHSCPEHNNDRFTIAGKYILESRPDTVLCLGDFADMGSLSSYDRGKKSFEGRRVINDIAAANDANYKLWEPINSYNAMRKRNRDKQYKPKKVMLLGNHEDRITRAVESDAELDGLISVDSLGYTDHGWEVVPYQVPYIYENIAFCHSFVTGVSGQPVSGANVAASLLLKNHMSSVVGHNHIKDYDEKVRADGKRICGLSAGWYGDFTPGFALASSRFWWSGLTMLHDVNDGAFETEFISMRMLKEQYDN